MHTPFIENLYIQSCVWIYVGICMHIYMPKNSYGHTGQKHKTCI